MDILLIVILVLLGGMALHGYLRGMVRMVFSLIAIFLVIGITSWIFPYTAVFLQEQTPLYDAVQENCIEAVQKKLGENAADKTQKPKEQQESENITMFGIEIPAGVQDFFQENVVEQAAGQIAEVILQRIAWILTFLAVSLLMGVLVHVLDLIAKLPVLESVNHMGGLVVGLLEGLVIVWILFLVITLCQGNEWGSQMMEEVQENVFLKLLYENNPIEKLIMRK
ncbi:MAG: CvpA family protein [Lachnospiraceae bacterium]|nr:CvpA family protein [Lachnospiraceae bacterium]